MSKLTQGLAGPIEQHPALENMEQTIQFLKDKEAKIQYLSIEEEDRRILHALFKQKYFDLVHQSKTWYT